MPPRCITSLLGACTGTQLELQKMGPILQTGDFSELLREGRGKSHLGVPCVSSLPPRELQF